MGRHVNKLLLNKVTNQSKALDAQINDEDGIADQIEDLDSQINDENGIVDQIDDLDARVTALEPSESVGE